MTTPRREDDSSTDRARLDPAGPFARIPLEPHQLVDRVTRSEDVIVLCHLGVPRLDAAGWTLAIDGQVERPLRLTLDDLSRRPRVELPAIHQCCGSPLEPDVPTRRITNVTWAGVRLADLLAECRPSPGARFVWSHGADHGVIEGEEIDAYRKDLPIDRVAEDVLVALEMNGAPLSPEHGHPARLVVPGFYGTNSVKWLTRLTLGERRATGRFTTRWYSDPVRDASGQPTGATIPVWSIAPESVIVSPAPDARVVAGQEISVWGWSWADGGVESVEIGVGGAGWTPAAVEPSGGRAWQRFTATWRPERRGRVELCSRARHADGRGQPDTGARNAVHRVPVEVV